MKTLFRFCFSAVLGLWFSPPMLVVAFVSPAKAQLERWGWKRMAARLDRTTEQLVAGWLILTVGYGCFLLGFVAAQALEEVGTVDGINDARPVWTAAPSTAPPVGSLLGHWEEPPSTRRS